MRNEFPFSEKRNGENRATRPQSHIRKLREATPESIQNTLKYIDLEAMLFKTTDDQFHVKVVANVQEACALIEAGFEYVTGEYNDGSKIFRKRK